MRTHKITWPVELIPAREDSGEASPLLSGSEQPAQGVLLELDVLRVPETRDGVPRGHEADAAAAVFVGPAGLAARALIPVLGAGVIQPVLVDAPDEDVLGILVVDHIMLFLGHDEIAD